MEIFIDNQVENHRNLLIQHQLAQRWKNYYLLIIICTGISFFGKIINIKKIMQKCKV